MVYSMTGFGKAVATTHNKKITVEVKSLNSKQLDFSARIPSLYREKEMEIRNIVAKRLERGKVDVTIYTENLTVETTATFNLAVLQGYKKQIEEVAKTLAIDVPQDWYAALLRLPDVMKTDAQPQLEADEAEAVLRATGEAVEAVMQFRATEGAKLDEFFRKKIANIRGLLAQVDPYEKERVEKIRQRINDNLLKLGNVDFDRSRFEQEMIFYIEKLDVNEEKQRLTQHLNYFIETLEGNCGQGKKLGFISQEMGREINTLGSKSNHAEMQKIVVKMKDELEQIKEQVLNVM
ncbi:MAG: YicC family protein [Muribaculaceae bacterium]|nr:YicC family protein [Muribaculaceae bacterium]MBR5435332.1 YicC family protein [Muribaculaceae bacterium]MBR5743742.1 YicC family protein [Muribaculaceae bacterium]